MTCIKPYSNRKLVNVRLKKNIFTMKVCASYMQIMFPARAKFATQVYEVDTLVNLPVVLLKNVRLCKFDDRSVRRRWFDHKTSYQ